MKIEKLKVDDLIPYTFNAKLHPQHQIEQIISSIEEFGMNDPIAVDENNVIIEGHGRLLALKQMGVKDVDCIRLSHLTDEQKKAYTLVHNKLTMNTDFDISLLEDELKNIYDIDMEEYGFDLDFDIEVPDYKEETQELKENILNLGYAQFVGVGKYDIPYIEPIKDVPEVKEWIGFNYVLSDKKPQGKGVHFFVDDYQFERVWNNPDAYIEKLKQYECVLAPDFSPYGDMPLATQIFNHYRKHWVAVYWQMHGITVIPTIRSSTDQRSLEWYLDGEPSESPVAYSSMWLREDREDIYEAGKKEYESMIKNLNPSQIFVYGNVFPFMEKEKDKITQIEKFTEKRWGKKDAESEQGNEVGGRKKKE
ncbi:MAG: DUF4417 domain-containing protein [Eubacterium sp.]